MFRFHNSLPEKRTSVDFDSIRLNGLIVHASHQYLPCSISMVELVVSLSDCVRSDVRYKSDVGVTTEIMTTYQ